MKDFLTTLLKSLNEVEVKGKQNMDIMLGCMMAVEKMLNQLDTPEEESEVKDDG